MFITKTLIICTLLVYTCLLSSRVDAQQVTLDKRFTLKPAPSINQPVDPNPTTNSNTSTTANQTSTIGSGFHLKPINSSSTTTPPITTPPVTTPPTITSPNTTLPKTSLEIPPPPPPPPPPPATKDPPPVKKDPPPVKKDPPPVTKDPPPITKNIEVPNITAIAKPSTTSHDCDQVPLTPDSWKQLKIDDFLKSYPRGDNTSLQEFAAQHGAYNFLCGLGETCHAGQLCSPIQGPAWYILFASQQYNNFQQALYDAIGFVSSETQAIGAQLVKDIYPQLHKKKAFHDFKVGMALTLLSAIAASLACAIFIWIPSLQVVAVGFAIAAATAIASTAELLKAQSEDKKASKEDPFTKWSHFAQEISGWQLATQNLIGSELQKHITKGVSTDDGIYGIIRDGHYSFNVQTRTLADLENGYREVIVARLVNEMLKAKEGFVTIGSDACNQGGPAGAFKAEDGWLSYCDENGVMMNIIVAHNDGAENHWPMAPWLAQKYGTTVEYLTKQSRDCQKKYGPLFDPYITGAFPYDKNSDCLVNMLVCDCTLPGMKKQRKKHNTVYACRHHLGLPV